MKFITIIPARFASTRLLAKPLVNIHGKPMVVHAMECAFQSGSSRVIVATDHPDIAMVVKSFGGEFCMTSVEHCSGTERLSEVIDKYKFDDDTIIVNLQCDELMIPPEILFKVASNLVYTDVNIATIATFIKDPEDTCNPNTVKVVVDHNSNALYFSRAIIPWDRENYTPFCKLKKIHNTLLRHIGIYAYKAHFIKRYVSWEPCHLEKIERLEQLRCLWYGEKINVGIVQPIDNFSIDSTEDLFRVRTAMKNNRIIRFC